MYFFKLFLFCIISCLIGFVISAKLELCENGGVSFQGHCICPPHFRVDHNYKNKEEKIKLEKALMNFYEMSDNPLGYPYNIKLMEETFHGNWGSPALVYMEVASYTHLFDMVNQRISALNESEKPKSSYQWSHVINLSLNDMPLVPLSRLQQYFCTNLNTSYIQSYHESYDERYSISLMEKSDTQYHDVSHHLFEKYECGLDGCNHYYNRSIARYGTQWHMLTYKFVHFMISDMRAIERMFQMKFSVIPDETYFQQANQIFMNDVETKRTYHSQNVISTQLQSSTIKRHTMWNRGDHKNRYEVLIPDLEQFLINNRKDNEDKHIFFIRKVYDQEVKDHIINNFINIK
ncbi:GlcNAc transferase [Heterostelium album PN500]|uniref:protein xylosyltransferase n=1 Tax=Heterostelium pallidum (strain ATCC 26659 / Pp 5 / PN500) TaxID=670386 RepID=D3B3Z6_HETP5|nr:GlcNAc transferase [Heterostelium album PN500]EFA84044.1 GlcNAc transferase [Heterostelium album PN500]|eukprot:XP_020436161.1 GlcNAc transferase [Heterostelium album PN500]